MALLKFENVGIRAISATVPKKVVKTRSLTEYYSEEEIEKFVSATGVEERRFVEPNQCASDLCYKSACQIFDETDIKREDIDALFFISQTPDYKIPGTSIIMQDKLGLRKDTIVYDVNMSCSGFIHGLLMAYSFLQIPNVNNIMLMVGDTLSKMISLKDKGTGKLLGDAGTVSVISKGQQFGESFFSMCTEGDNIETVIVKAGGAEFHHQQKRSRCRNGKMAVFAISNRLLWWVTMFSVSPSQSCPVTLSDFSSLQERA